MIDKALLQKHCYDIARATMWEHRNPQSSSLDAITSQANLYMHLAIEHFSKLEDVSPGFLVESVGFIRSLAVPPMGSDHQWFIASLAVIEELACPNSELPHDDKESVSFLRKLRDAIDRTIVAD